MVQEGVRNAVKHSQGSVIDLSIDELEDKLTIHIKDNGIGLPWDVVPPDDTLIQQGHLGVVGLKERVQELSGSLVLSNNNGDQGATMTVVISS